jgi:hypothetical protein
VRHLTGKHQCTSDRNEPLRRLRATVKRTAILKPFQSNCSPSGHASASFLDMATQTPTPPVVEHPRAAGPGEVAAEKALVPSPQALEREILIPPSSPVSRLPVEVDVAVPLRDFRVRGLLALEPGTVVESEWGHGEDLPLASGNVQLAWSEFEVVETQLAVRLTRLA